MNANGSDVAVVGAGIIGLSVAWELACRGARVRVFDRAEPGRGASWAGAGMLAPYTECVDDEPMLALCARSLAAYPSFVERLRAQTGVDARLQLDGVLDVAYDASRADALQVRMRALRAHDVACDVVKSEALRSLEPALDPAASCALLVRGEGSVDNRRLGRALAAACVASGVTIVSDAGGASIDCDRRRVRGVRSERGFTPADMVVNAAGAWAATLAGVPACAIPPVEPVKGEMLALAVPVGFMRRVTWVPGAYLVPRGDGRLLVGATVERDGFNERATARGQHALLAAALRAAPALGGFTVVEAWSGLRPGTPDGRPYLGASGFSGLYLATGHYRNGILLAPATASVVADAVAGRVSDEAAPFLPGRAPQF